MPCETMDGGLFEALELMKLAEPVSTFRFGSRDTRLKGDSMRSLSRHGFITTVALLGGFMVGATPATRAGFVASTWETEANAYGVSSLAAFTATGNTLFVTLTNLTEDPKDIADVLTRIQFTLSNGLTFTPGDALNSVEGVERTIASNNTFTDNPVSGTMTIPNKANWALQQAGSAYRLTRVGSGVGQVDYGIIGPPTGSVYTANSSVAGNGPHNPFLFGTATFELTVQGLNNPVVDYSITGVTFLYGSGPENPVNGFKTGAVPEPSSVLMGGMALAALAGFSRLRRGLSA